MDLINPSALLYVAAVLCVFTATVHSVLGEKRLITPIIASGIPVMETKLARNVTRFAWHWTSALWVCVAAVLALMAAGEINSPTLLLVIGVAHVIAGIADAILTDGKHIGWPFITIIGVLALLAYFAINT